jgi:hypothetical protein
MLRVHGGGGRGGKDAEAFMSKSATFLEAIFCCVVLPENYIYLFPHIALLTLALSGLISLSLSYSLTHSPVLSYPLLMSPSLSQSLSLSLFLLLCFSIFLSLSLSLFLFLFFSTFYSFSLFLFFTFYTFFSLSLSSCYLFRSLVSRRSGEPYKVK